MSMLTLERDRPVREPDDPRRAAAARRVLSRWALRLAVREWKQRILIVLLITVATAATVLGIAVASATPGTPNYGIYGTASTLVQLPGNTPDLPGVIAKIEKAYGAASVIDDQPIVTGQAGGADLRAQDPNAPYTHVLLALDSGRYPTAAGQVAVTSGLAQLYGLRIGSVWHVPASAGASAGRAFIVTGIVENPSNLLDEFALVPPGQFGRAAERADLPRGIAGLGRRGGGRGRHPRQRDGQRAAALGHHRVAGDDRADRLGARPGLHRPGRVRRVHRDGPAQAARPRHARVARRDRERRAVRAARRRRWWSACSARFSARRSGWASGSGTDPHLETATAHRTDPPRPALGGRDHRAAARRGHLRHRRRLAGTRGQQGPGGRRALRPGHRAARDQKVAAPRPHLPGRRPVRPVLLRRLARRRPGRLPGHRRPDRLRDRVRPARPVRRGPARPVAGRAPLATRLALRDLARYRSRSGAALAAVSFAVFLATVAIVIASVRFDDALDYVARTWRPTSSSLYAPGNDGSQYQPGQFTPAAKLAAARHEADTLAAQLHAPAPLELDLAVSTHVVGARPACAESARGAASRCTARGSAAACTWPPRPCSRRSASARARSTRPPTCSPCAPGCRRRGASRWLSGSFLAASPPGCPAGMCIVEPGHPGGRQAAGGTSVPNMVITEQAVRALHETIVPVGWLVQAPAALTPVQVNAARQAAVAPRHHDRDASPASSASGRSVTAPPSAASCSRSACWP